MTQSSEELGKMGTRCGLSTPASAERTARCEKDEQRLDEHVKQAYILHVGLSGTMNVRFHPESAEKFLLLQPVAPWARIFGLLGASWCLGTGSQVLLTLKLFRVFAEHAEEHDLTCVQV